MNSPAPLIHKYKYIAAGNSEKFVHPWCSRYWIERKLKQGASNYCIRSSISSCTRVTWCKKNGDSLKASHNWSEPITKLDEDGHLLKSENSALSQNTLCSYSSIKPIFVSCVDTNFQIDLLKHFLLQYAAWLCLTNSAVNFIIYGATNPDHRKGYRKLLATVLCGKKPFSK